MAKLTKDEIVTLQVLNDKGKSKRSIARQLNVSEGTVRYHLRRQATSATDGRKKRTLIETLGLVAVVAHWWNTQRELLPKDRLPNVQELWLLLVEEHRYSGSYKSVAKYVRKRFPKPKFRENDACLRFGAPASVLVTWVVFKTAHIAKTEAGVVFRRRFPWPSTLPAQSLRLLHGRSPTKKAELDILPNLSSAIHGLIPGRVGFADGYGDLTLNPDSAISPLSKGPLSLQNLCR